MGRCEKGCGQGGGEVGVCGVEVESLVGGLGVGAVVGGWVGGWGVFLCSYPKGSGGFTERERGERGGDCIRSEEWVGRGGRFFAFENRQHSISYHIIFLRLLACR